MGEEEEERGEVEMLKYFKKKIPSIFSNIILLIKQGGLLHKRYIYLLTSYDFIRDVSNES